MKTLLLGGTCDLAHTIGETLMARGDLCVFTHRTEEGRRKIKEKFGHEGYELLYWSLEEPKGIAFLLDDPPDVIMDFAHERLDGIWAAIPSENIVRYFTLEVAARAYTIQTLVKGALKHRKPMKFIYISSMAVPNPNPGQGLYAASKAASEELYRTLGLELSSKQIYSMVVRLGYVQAGRAMEFLSDYSIALDVKLVKDTLLALTDTPGKALSGQIIEIPTQKMPSSSKPMFSGTVI